MDQGIRNPQRQRAFSEIYYCPDCGRIMKKSLITESELEVLKGYAAGLSTKEIAALRFISHKTVEAHRMHLLVKTGKKTLAEAVYWAAKIGLLH